MSGREEERYVRRDSRAASRVFLSFAANSLINFVSLISVAIFASVKSKLYSGWWRK